MRRPFLTRLRSDDTGAISLFVAVAGVALLLAIGLVVDGGAKIRAIQRAHTAAAEAARAGAQELDPSSMYGKAVKLDAHKAASAARDYLSVAGVSGTVNITGDAELTVETTDTAPTVFLNLIGIGEVSGHATETVALERG